MVKDLSGLEKLIEDLKKEGIFESYFLENNIAHIHTKQFLLLIYLPNTERLDIKDIQKIIHIDIDILNSSYTKVWKRLTGLMGKGRRIYARETVVARLDKKVALEFLEEYHLNVPLAGKYRYGLYYKGELVSVAVFSGGRIMREIGEEYRSFELIRFCHKSDYLVIGGISKLIKSFVKDFKPNDIMTYADRDWSQESSLESIGFKAEGIVSSQNIKVFGEKRLTHSDSPNNYDYIIKNNGSIKLKLYL